MSTQEELSDIDRHLAKVVAAMARLERVRWDLMEERNMLNPPATEKVVSLAAARERKLRRARSHSERPSRAPAKESSRASAEAELPTSH